MKQFARLFAATLIFSSAAQAQTVEEVSHINLSGGVTLYSSLTGRQDPAPSNLSLKLTGVKTNTEKKGTITVIVRGAPASKTTAAGIAAPTTVLAAYGVLSGAVTPNYATYVAAHVDEVNVAFDEGDPNDPIVIGSAYSGGGMGGGKVEFREFAIAKFVDTASPSIYQYAFGNGGLIAQFNIANPEISVLTPACANVAAQLDVDTNGDLLVRVFQGSDASFPNVTVSVTVTPTGTAPPFQVEAVTDANGLAQFNGSGNTVALNSQNPITGISLQFSEDGAAESCIIQGNPNPCGTSATPASKKLSAVE